MSNEFFDEFMEDPYMDEIGGGDFKTIARAIVQPAYQGWQFGSDPKVFPYDGSKKAGLIAKEKCAEYCKGDNSYPQPGLLTTIYGDDVPTHPEGAMSQDWLDFVPVFHSAKKYTGQVDVSGQFPYDLVFEGAQNNRKIFNQIQWCELSRPIDNVREPGRDKEASKYPRRIYVVERIFKSREEAYEAAGKSPASTEDDFGDFGGNEELSKFAAGNRWSLAALRLQSQNIHAAIAAAMLGEGTPDDKEMTEDQARTFVCENYAIDVSDLDLLDEANEAPF